MTLDDQMLVLVARFIVAEERRNRLNYFRDLDRKGTNITVKQIHNARVDVELAKSKLAGFCHDNPATVISLRLKDKLSEGYMKVIQRAMV